MNVEIATLSKPGGRDYNEDVFGQWSNERFVMCLVADGAGGHGGGDVAASTARESILRGFAANPALGAGLLRGLLEQANLDVVARQHEGGRLAAMRTTAVVAAVDLDQGVLVWAHSGDSRAYLFRDGCIVARTTDHSLVQQMVNGGMLDDESARLHPQRNMLLSALGSAQDPPEIDGSERMRLQQGDIILLCSDGVWEVLGDERLVNSLAACRDAHQWLNELDIRVCANAKPGHDNYTAVALLMLDEDFERTRLMPSA